MISDNEILASKILNIRHFEESLDALFETRKIFGTYHRCIGQEATAVAFCHYLKKKDDFIVSNHRNHGHYLSFTEDYAGLMNEILGNEKGVSKGLGGSQVLLSESFFSNGIIGSTVAVAAGVSLGIKIKKKPGICVCFIGDGAMGQGIVYESLNMSSLYNLPILYVVEQNNISQSTNLNEITSGSLQKRFESFGIETKKINSSNVYDLVKHSIPLIKKVRKNIKPYCVIIESDRLCAHSKGDDFRKNLRFANDPLKSLKKYNKNYDILNSNSKKLIKNLIDSLV
jgi:TPP-dependent pyruvate/acetoin dehydrogenase alpha subunit